jgi:cell division protease FtsH
MQLPEEDKYNYKREYMESSIAILLAGRLAEEIFLGTTTTGASNDLERVTDLARKMVCEWGMSEEMGPLTFGKREEQIFLGREIAQHQDYSESTAIKIDKEVKRIVLEGHARAKKLLEENKESLVGLAEALLEYETLDSEEIPKIIRGEKIRQEEPEVAAAPEDDEPSPKTKEKKPVSPLVKPEERPATA